MAEQNESKITIHCVIAAKLNFAWHQSAFPFLRELRIENKNLDSTLENVSVTLSSNPAFLKTRKWTLDRIAPNSNITVNNKDIELDGGFLLNLTDSIRGSVSIMVEHDGNSLAAVVKPVELLAYNEWGGTGYMPELLAAFSIPNDPAVDRILHDASLILRKAGKKDGIDGYKSGRRERVWEIASAIYTAICNLGITYALPPASFEHDGQKIRLPGQILQNRNATCLDSTLLFASIFEQAGLNAIILLPKGHALIGVWLQPEELSSITIDDAETLRKRIQLDELLIIETTFVTNHPAPPFTQAIKNASSHIVPENDESFDSAIDIRRARDHRINPLGLKTGRSTEATDYSNTQQIEIPFEEAPPLSDFDLEMGEEQPDTPEGRLERWQRKLLDLSARNPLLNHKSTKSSLTIICPNPGLLEDKLAANEKITIKAKPILTGQTQDEELHRQRTGESISEEYALSALEKNQVIVELSEDELSKRTVEIYRKAQTALQEGGSNTLYLALGFLLWQNDEKDKRRFKAPLILLPVALERKSVRSGVKLVAHDDEPRFNTTLLEMLRKDFAIEIRGLDGALPEDHSGIDVKGIWNKVRFAIKEAPGFEVVEDVVLGHFSFAKFLMWKDLVDRSDDLKRNSVVKHLIDTPRDPYSTDIGFVNKNEIDRHFKPSDLLTPLPADASQMAVIATADRGKDFVIIGPPGTGKSQTISNLIAHMLGKRKTVLFVSEKTAALQVVHRRLENVGLGRYCLQLHSNKTNKKDVLEQLRRSWDSEQNVSAEIWQKEADRLCQYRNQLNRLVNRLHVQRRNGLTAHYAIGVKVRDRHLATSVSFSWHSADHHDESRLEQMRSAVGHLQTQANAVKNITNNPFNLIRNADWSPQWEGKVVEYAGRLSTATINLEKHTENLLNTINLSIPDRTLHRMEALSELAKTLLESYRKETAFALDVDGSERIEALGESIIRLNDYKKAQGSLSCPYHEMAWRKLNGDEIAQQWEQSSSYWWLKRFLRRRRIVKTMKKGGAKGKPNPFIDAPLLRLLRDNGKTIDHLEPLLSSFKDWKGHSTDPGKMQEIQQLGKRARQITGKLADETMALLETRRGIKSLLAEGNDMLSPETSIGRAIIEYLKAYQHFQSACEQFEAIAGRSVREHFAETDKALVTIRSTADKISENHAELSAWCGWRRRRDEAVDLELSPLVEAIEKGHLPPLQIKEVFEAAYCTWWSGAVIGEDEVLRTFSTPEHMAAIDKFRELDSKFQKLTAEYISAILTGTIPDPNDVKRSSDWGVLRHEIQKKSQHKPVRQLLNEIPNVLTTLSPCLMMSPLSVAQYLPSNQALFDVVIFDEASQIAVWDAVGSIARGNQVIIVGDPKQMPPTNFFARSDDDPDGDVSMEGDLESILDEMLGASIPKQVLNLHYRSKKESLIAFSNNRYYDNQLITFPAPIRPDNGVKLISVEGTYSRGKARHNEGEAKAIVNEILVRLKHEDPSVRNQSIGVVTFNTEQQTLIENLLDEARSKNVDIEKAFSSDCIEPVFVKNLETVQGDERDVILFSITYGPDQSGHVTMNFGPLNRSGGERRLNVAMTRARSEMLVFSTLKPEDIDLSRSQALAVKDLKHFLEYAEKGISVLGSAIHGSMGDHESPFETAVASAYSEQFEH